jgi:diphosphomevalonate decarboxylase
MRFMLILNFQDTILLVDKGENKFRTVGHDLMHNHPLPKGDLHKRMKNLDALITIFESGDLDAFIKIVESEALTLHAMMMTLPYFILMKPNTLQIINAI